MIFHVSKGERQYKQKLFVFTQLINSHYYLIANDFISMEFAIYAVIKILNVIYEMP